VIPSTKNHGFIVAISSHWTCSMAHLVEKTWQFRCCTSLLESCIRCIHFLNSVSCARNIYRSLSLFIPRRQSIHCLTAC